MIEICERAIADRVDGLAIHGDRMILAHQRAILARQRDWHISCSVPPMRPEDLRKRSRAFGLAIIQLFRRLPRTRDYQRVGDQLLRASNALVDSYPSAGRARSKAEFVAKMGELCDHADESLQWLEILREMGSRTLTSPRCSRRPKNCCVSSSRHTEPPADVTGGRPMNRRPARSVKKG